MQRIKNLLDFTEDFRYEEGITRFIDACMKDKRFTRGFIVVLKDNWDCEVDCKKIKEELEYLDMTDIRLTHLDTTEMMSIYRGISTDQILVHFRVVTRLEEWYLFVNEMNDRVAEIKGTVNNFRYGVKS